MRRIVKRLSNLLVGVEQPEDYYQHLVRDQGAGRPTFSEAQRDFDDALRLQVKGRLYA